MHSKNNGAKISFPETLYLLTAFCIEREWARESECMQENWPKRKLKLSRSSNGSHSHSTVRFDADIRAQTGTSKHKNIEENFVRVWSARKMRNGKSVRCIFPFRLSFCFYWLAAAAATHWPPLARQAVLCHLAIVFRYNFFLSSQVHFEHIIFSLCAHLVGVVQSQQYSIFFFEFDIFFCFIFLVLAKYALFRFGSDFFRYFFSLHFSAVIQKNVYVPFNFVIASRRDVWTL